MDHPYIEERNGGYYLRGSRVSLDSIVYHWLEGQSAEAIRDTFPTLKLVEVYGAITYYLEHQAEIDRYLKEGDALFEAQREAREAADPAWHAELRRRMAEARERLQSAQASAS
jgi:uncharacterized protein (DUF433 family)